MKKITLWLFTLFTCLFLNAQTGTVIIGVNDGTPNTATGYPSPLQDYYKTQRSQYLYTAAELSGAGLIAGNITEVGWVATALNLSGLQENYTISMKSTTATSLTTTFQTGATVVYGPADFTPSSTGNVMFTLTTPFVWDGTSNIIIELCAGLASGGYTENVSCANSTMSGNYTTYYRNDSATAPCTTATGTTTNQRPLVVLTGNVATCLAPLNLVSASITAYTANVSWDASTSGSASGYEYVVSTSNVTPTGSGTPTTNLYASLAGLSPTTTYYVFVRTNCGGTFSGWGGPISFTTACAPVTTLPWTEGFEGLTTVGTTNFPSCWSKENGGWESRNSNDTYSTARTGTKYIRNAWSATNEFIWTPGFNLVAGTSYDFSSYIQGDNAVSWVVDYFVNSAQNSTGATQIGTTYNVPGTGTTYTAQAYNKVTATFVPATSGTYYFAVRVNESTGDPWYVSFDDFKLEITPTCLEPVNLTSINVTSTGADLSWDAMIGSVGYEYVVTTSATPPASGTATTNTYAQPTGLTPQTVYYLHVRTVCGAGAYSTWATYSFTTACAEVTSFIQNFDTVTTPAFPNCWFKVGTTGTVNTQTSSSSSLPNCLYIYGSSATNQAIVRTIPVSNLGAGTHRFKFKMRANFTVGGILELGYLTDPTDSNSFVALTSFTASSLTYANYVYNVPAGTYSSYPAFRHTGSPANSILVDDVIWEAMPNCPDQTGLIVSGITVSGANTSWDDMSSLGAIGYEYAVTTSATPPVSGTATTATFYPASGLSPQTVYYLHVRSSCTGGTFGNWSTVSFTTACAEVTSFIQNFDAVTTPAFPNCWFKVGTTGTVNTQTSSSSSTPNCLYIYGTSVTNQAIVRTIPVSNLGAGTHRFKFKMRANFTVGGILELGYLTNPTDSNSFVAFTSFTASSLTYSDYVYNVPAGTYSNYPAFRHTGSPANSILVDDVIWEALPSCPDMTGLVVSGVTAFGANTSWDDLAGSGATGYEYAITTSATPPASGTATTSTFYAATGLTPQTVYYLHVRSSCSGGVFGNWATITFTTACTPITALPWNEGFEGLTTVGTTNFPSCWYKENGGWESRNSNDTYSTSNTGTNFIRDAWSATNEYIWTPGFDLVAGTSYDFSSFIQGDNGTTWVVDYFVNSAQNSTGATQIGTTYNVPGTGTTYTAQAYNKVTATFVPATSGTYYFAVRVNESTGDPWYVSFDDFELKLTPATPPSCATGLTATPNATCGNFASTLSWTAEPLATGYYVTIGTTSGGSDIANAVPVSGTSYSFSGLNNSQYFWKVVPYNGAGSATGCTEQSFTTAVNGCYCSSVPSSVDNSGITNVVLGATPYTIAPVTYVDNTATPEIIAPGATANLQLTFSTGYTYDINVWIDFNNDFDFDDAGELVKTGIACTNVQPNTVDASFTMPLTAPSGPHRMRIGTADSGQVPPAPCYNGSYGVTLDFTVDTSLATSSFDLSNFVAYPNPVKDVLNLSYSTAITNVKVTNLLGQQVMTKNVNDTNVQVNMADLAVGTYIVNISSGDLIHTIKVIKQ